MSPFSTPGKDANIQGEIDIIVQNETDHADLITTSAEQIGIDSESEPNHTSDCFTSISGQHNAVLLDTINSIYGKYIIIVFVDDKTITSSALL